MHKLYNIGISFYGFAIRLASFFNPKAKKWVQGRVNFWQQLPDVTSKDVIWFHCASLGEFDQGLPLMEEIKKHNPKLFLLVTFFSPSGFDHYHKRKHKADFVCYLPLDTVTNAKKFAQHFNPKVSIFVKYEFWGNYINAVKENGAKLFVISGLFRNDHHFFKWYGSYFRTILSKIDHFFVQDKNSQILLNSIGLSNVSITGDNRFDRVIANSRNAQLNTIIESFRDNQNLVIIGSSWPADEELLTPWINSTDTKVLIAPHQIEDQHIQQLEKKLTRSSIRYSQWKNNSNCQVLILDTIGHLASAYQSGHIAYVGGGFSGSLHNILEPAVFGLPVIFGPKYSRFPEAQQFIDGGFGFSCDTTPKFEETLDLIKQDYANISKKEKMFVEANAGASEKIMHHLIANSVL